MTRDRSDDTDSSASLAAGKPAFVWRRQIADTDTPVSAALALIEPERGDFLLESVEGGQTRGRHSLIGLAPDLIFRARGTKSEVNGAEVTGSPIDVLRALVAECRAEVPAELPRALACLVGYFAYEAMGLIERLPRPPENPLQLPDMLFVRPTLILVFDRLADELFLIAPLWPGEGDAGARVADAWERIDATAARLARPERSRRALVESLGSVPLDYARDERTSLAPALKPGRYRDMVARAQEYIQAGDIFQVVLAQRFTAPFPLPPFDLYRA